VLTRTSYDSNPVGACQLALSNLTREPQTLLIQLLCELGNDLGEHRRAFRSHRVQSRRVEPQRVQDSGRDLRRSRLLCALQ